MKELICDMCGSNNIIKQDGLFVCQDCNTKYSVEEAKRMYNETVKVRGTVKIDSSSELSNLYEIARRAKDTNNAENALRYYDQILIKDPNSWEAQFYVVYFRAMVCETTEIGISASNLSDSISPILDLVKNNVGGDKQEEIILEIYERCSSVSNLLFKITKNWYLSIDNKFKKKIIPQYNANILPIAFIMFSLGDSLIEAYGNQFTNIASRSWIDGVELYKKYPDTIYRPSILKDYLNKIRQYQPNYKPKSKACYIATSVYGSYDCPEVWTLRRFRDK